MRRRPAEKSFRRSRWGLMLFFLCTLYGLFSWHVVRLPIPDYAPCTTDLVRGVFHLHSAASHDAKLPVDAYAKLASHLDLQFLVFTEHNRDTVLPQKLADVWLLSQPELSTPWGHVIALDAQAPSLDGYTRGTTPVASIRKAGGKAILAHPFDKKRPWTRVPLDMDGLEIANTAASLRRRIRADMPTLVSALLSYPWHQDLALAQMCDRDTLALALWDQQQDAKMPGFCASDGHGWLGAAIDLRAWHLILDPQRLASVESLSPSQILQSLGAGHFYCMAGWLKHAANLRFFGKTQIGTVLAGSETSKDELHELIVETQPLAAGETQLILYRNGRPFASTAQTRLRILRPPAGHYRVEIYAKIPRPLGSARWLPVLYSNRLTLT